MLRSLQLKSLNTASTDGSPAKPSYAVLSVGEDIYQIRQVSTSNSVFLLQPSIGPGDEDHPRDPGVTAIATIGSTLELLPASSGSSSTTSRKWHERFKKAAK